MCIGIPMRVVEVEQGYAWCEGRDGRQQVDTLLVGDVPVGAWLLVFLGSAREVLQADEARRIVDALEALDLAMQGEASVDHLFADLVEREPQLPDFLQAAPVSEKS